MKELKKYKLVLIEWVDAQSDCKWASKEELEKWVKQDCIIYDIGWIAIETKKYIVLSSQFGNEDGEWGNRTKIPTEWIRKRTKVKINY